METLLGPLRLATTIIGAAGPFGVVPDPTRLPVDPPLGAVVTTSLAYRSHGGTATRVAETPAGAVYTPAGSRTGVRGVLRRHAARWALSATPVVVSLGDDSAAAFGAAAAEIEGTHGVAAIELNLLEVDESSGLLFGEDPALAGEVVRAVRRACALPVWVKLPVDVAGMEGTLHACAAAGATAATLGGGLAAATHTGGGYLVGPATFAVVLGLLSQVLPDAPLPVIACGGVTSAAEARAYLSAGAAAVQVGSAHLANPRAAEEVIRDLAGWPTSGAGRQRS